LAGAGPQICAENPAIIAQCNQDFELCEGN
jgi:hypothetical protein